MADAHSDRLEEIGEFGFIARMSAGCVCAPERVVCGIGDDCAVSSQEPGKLRLVTTDLMVEGVHFLRHEMPPSQLGGKCMAVNLSDIAAMGGRPLDAFVSLAIPAGLPLTFLEQLYSGLKTMAGRHGVNILGGDTSSARSDLVVSITVVGEAEGTHVLTRRGARAGDRIFLSGYVGDAAAGRHALTHGYAEATPEARHLAARYCQVDPAVALGRALSRSGLVHAMLDVSDGVASDVQHICRHSQVGCLIESSRLPLSPQLCAYAAAQGLDPLALALSGGEDYVLLLAGSAAVSGCLAPQGFQLTEIGVIQSDCRCLLKDESGATRPLETTGWDHFAASAVQP